MRLSLRPAYGSHLPVLMKIMNETEGDVLELGAGLYSTPFLHWTCFPTKRKLVTYDTADYNDVMKKYRDTSFHETHVIDNYDDINIEKPWTVAFIDHAPEIQRGKEAKRLANYAQYVILHDSEPSNDIHYKYNEVYPLYKYRFDYKDVAPNTTVLSNFIDLTNFKI